MMDSAWGPWTPLEGGGLDDGLGLVAKAPLGGGSLGRCGSPRPSVDEGGPLGRLLHDPDLHMSQRHNPGGNPRLYVCLSMTKQTLGDLNACMSLCILQL